jgi:hypothetical protein
MPVLLVLINLPLVLVSIRVVDYCSLRAHLVVSERPVVGRAIGEHHFAKSLESAVEELSYVKEAGGMLIIPVLTSSMHLVRLERSFEYIIRLEAAHAPSVTLALLPLASVLTPHLARFLMSALPAFL